MIISFLGFSPLAIKALTDSRIMLAEYIKKALENGELIVDPEDGRVYEGLRHFNYDPDKPVKVIEEQDTGLNEYFLDQSNGNVMHRDEFIALINGGNYPGYKVVTSGGKRFPMSRSDGDAGNNLG